MKRRTKQLLSMLLAVCMVTMMFPTGAFALEPTPEQTPAGSGIVKVADEPTATPAATPAEAATGESASALDEAQQAFVDAVAALDKDALTALAEAYKADPTEGGEAETAFNAEYDKVEGFEGSAATLYAALTTEQQAEETVAAAKATLDEIISAVNAVLAIETPAENKDIYDDAPNYLTFTAEEAGSTVTFNYDDGSEVMYKLGDDAWIACTSGTTITLASVGNAVSFKGTDVTTSWDNHFSMTGSLAASGDVTSLTNGVGGDATLTDSCYSYMFKGCTGLTTAPALPATTLAESCYNSMFDGCIGLTAAPALPAATLSISCYDSMFYGCTGLAAAPALPATTLAEECYTNMFAGCTGLIAAPALPATTLANSCYCYMFYGCTGLTAAPALRATTLAVSCYQGMFIDCTGLTAAPALPAATLAISCYNGMFSGCTGLTAAPTLNATTLANNCYDSMFNDCTGLTTAPELPATTLAESCYSLMFYGCTGIRVSTTKTGDYTKEWRIPTTEDTTTTASTWNSSMLVSTGGTFTGNPELNTTYYLYEAHDLTVTGGAWDTDYTYEGGVITVLTDTPLTISGTTTAEYIRIGDGISALTANVTIDGLTIKNATLDSALHIAANTTLNLTVLGENELKGKIQNIFVAGGSTLNMTADSTGTLASANEYGHRRSGIYANGATVNLYGGTLKGDVPAQTAGILYAAQLNVYGGSIVSKEAYNAASPVIQVNGTITVSGGTHKIFSATSAALYSTPAKDVVITGGSLNFTRQNGILPMGENPPTDGNGNKVYLTTITLDGVSTATEVIGLGYEGANSYNITDVYTDDAGKLYFYLPAEAKVTCVSTTAGMYVGSVTTTDDSTAAATFNREDLAVTGGERGTDYTYENGVLTVLTDTPLTIANWNLRTPATDRIVAANGVAVNLTLSGVNIDCTGLGTNYGVACPINLRNSGGVSTITLADRITNTLKADGDSAGILMNEDTTATEGALVIKGGENGTGVLNVTGGSDVRPAIGGAAPYLTIEGGVINATGGNNCAAIGNSQGQYRGTINITGGSIKATPAVIGGDECTVNITGGSFAVGNVDARTVYSKAVADTYCVKNNGGNYPYAVVACTAVTITPTTDKEKLTQTFSDSTIDATQLFIFDEHCGTAAYTLLEGGTGEGTITEAGVLTVTKVGTFKIKVDTAAHAEYAAGSAEVLLTVNPAIPAALELSGLITAPVKNATPVTAITGQTEYSGTITWSGTPAKFLGETVYTATVTLTPATNYTFTGLAANAFSYTGATEVTGTVAGADGKVTVTIVFPATGDRTVTELAADGSPAKTLYNIGETFDPAGMTITAKYDDGTTQVITPATAGYAVAPATMAADTTSVVVSYGGKSTSPITVAVRENLISITAPAAITDVANGAAKTAAALGLPAAVSIVTGTGATTTANVTWDVAAADYNPASLEAKTFTVNGTVELPAGMSNVNNVALTARVSVGVKAAKPAPKPDRDTTPGSTDTDEKITGIKEGDSVTVGSTLIVNVDEFIRGDKTYIPVAWATNPSGSFAHSGGKTYTAKVDTTGMTVGEHTFTITYREVTTADRAATGNTVETVIHYNIKAKPAEKGDDGDDDEDDGNRNGGGTGSTGNGQNPAGGGPRTGDNSQIMLWALLMLLSAGGVTASGIAQKKRKSHPEQ